MARRNALATLRKETQDFCQMLKVEDIVEGYNTFTSSIETDVFNIKAPARSQWTVFPDNIPLHLKLGITFYLGSTVDLYLKNDSLPTTRRMRLKFTIGFLDQNGQLLFPTTTEEFVECKSGDSLYWSAHIGNISTKHTRPLTFFTTENPNLLTDGAVTAFVSGTVEYNILTLSRDNKVFALETEDEEEEAVMSPLLAETHLADVTLKCEGLEIPCHKIILVWKSKVFQAMFKENNFIEAKDKMVEIKNTDAKTLEAFVHFIYSGKAKNLTSRAKELFSLADRYDIQPLKEKCTEYLQQNIQVEDVAEILVLGYLHNEANLKSKAMNFITKNFQEVRKTEEWEMIVKGHRKILDEVLLAMTEKM